MSETRTVKTAFFFLGTIVLISLTFAAGVFLGTTLTRPAPVQSSFSLPSLFPGASTAFSENDALFKPFWQTWDIVHDQFVEQPVNDTLMMQGAIRGMLDSLDDPHTSYMDPDQFRQQNMPLQGEYEGIGAWVDTTGEYLSIISPMPGSPAEKAGLKPGDLVVAINGEDMTGIDGNLVLRNILGPEGTSVTLSIRREGVEDPFDVTIIRQKIDLPSLKGEIIEDNIAYVQFLTFGETSADDLHAKLKELLAQNPQGLVFDLRNNGGGYLTTAVEVISEFIPAGNIALIEETGDGQRNSFKTNRGGLAVEIPIVILVNEGTASASEITAGAIQDYERGVLVGTKTFGKGSVQNWIPLENDQGAIRVTIARWLTPDGRQINKIGLTPDYEVEYSEADFEAGRDPQLEKAVELLLSK